MDKKKFKLSLNEAGEEESGESLLEQGQYDEAFRQAFSEEERLDIVNTFVQEKMSANAAEHIQPFFDTFYQELRELGFRSGTNPFIHYVDKFIVKKDVAIDKAKYDVIHNAYVNHDISTDGLLGKDKWGQKHVFWHKDLFLQDPQAIDYLIKLEDWILNNSNLSATVTRQSVRLHYGYPDKSGNYPLDEEENRKRFLIDLFYDGANIRENVFHNGTLKRNSKTNKYVLSYHGKIMDVSDGSDEMHRGFEEDPAYKNSSYTKALKKAADIESTLDWCTVKDRVDKDVEKRSRTNGRTFPWKETIDKQVTDDDKARKLIFSLISHFADQSQAGSLATKYGVNNVTQEIHDASIYNHFIDQIDVDKKNYLEVVDYVHKTKVLKQKPEEEEK